MGSLGHFKGTNVYVELYSIHEKKEIDLDDLDTNEVLKKKIFLTKRKIPQKCSSDA